MMTDTAVPYALIENLPSLVDSIKPDSIISRVFYKDDRLKTILFGFDAGQELSEHTSSHTAIIQIVQGEAAVTLNGDTHQLTAGAWIHMPPHLRHSVFAKTPLVMLLLMFGADER